ncbi:hypothetical protein ACQ4PT_052028 [Festuca glaucescens]
MTTPLQLVGSVGTAVTATAGAAGFVQQIVTYTVMDDLNVVHMSTISGITLLNTFGVTDIRSLQEKTVQLGYTEGLEMLKAALQSKTVLTVVFLGNKRKA